MKNLEDLLRNIKQLNLDKMEVRDSLYRISDWLTYEDHSVKDNYIQNQFEFLDKLIGKNKDYSLPEDEIIIDDDRYIIEL